MAKLTRSSSARSPFGGDANRIHNPYSEREPLCVWRDCLYPQWVGLPLCRAHATLVHRRVDDFYDRTIDAALATPSRPWNPQPFVYYLMVGPRTVKIGTTVDLRVRVSSLRTEMQYVVGLELGDRTMERQRHVQFAEERQGRWENFHLSERLKRHIDTLGEKRDELVAMATTRPVPQVSKAS